MWWFYVQHAPGVPKVLVGNRCHLAFKREVSELVAEEYAHRHDMEFLEVSPLCNFNITESLVTLSRVALQRNGMSRTWGINKGMIFCFVWRCCSIFSIIFDNFNYIRLLSYFGYILFVL
jgi:Ras family